MSGPQMSLLLGPQHAGLLTAGVATSLVGFSTPGGFGSIVGQTTVGGQTISFILDDSTGTPGLNIGVLGVQVQTLFTAVMINGLLRLTSSATFVAGATTKWFWPGLASMALNGVYEFGLYI